MTIRTLGGSKRCRVGPGRARIPATRAQGLLVSPSGVEQFAGTNRPVGPDTASCAPTAPVARLIRSGRDPRCPWKVSGARYRKTHLLGLGGHELGRSLDRLGDDSATDGDLAGGLTGAADGLRVADGRHGEGSGHGGHAHEEVFSGAGVNTERSASTRRASQRVRARGSSVPLFSPIRKISQDGDLSFCRLICTLASFSGACCPIEDLTSTRPLIGRRMPSHGLTIQV